jgi:hypothetical protein
VRAALGALAAAVLLTGCGSDRLSDAALRSKATVLCASAGRQASRIQTPSAPADGERFLRRGIAILSPELAALRKLKPPSDLQDVYEDALSSFSQKLELLRKTDQQLRSDGNPVTAMTALQQHLAPIELAEDGAWRALDVPACLNR